MSVQIPDQDESCKTDGTKMFRRADILAGISRQLQHTREDLWELEEQGRTNAANTARKRVGNLYRLRDEFGTLPTFTLPEYISADTIPNGKEWSERINLAIDVTGVPPSAKTAMLRLLADLRKPLEDLRPDEPD